MAENLDDLTASARAEQKALQAAAAAGEILKRAVSSVGSAYSDVSGRLGGMASAVKGFQGPLEAADRLQEKLAKVAEAIKRPFRLQHAAKGTSSRCAD